MVRLESFYIHAVFPKHNIEKCQIDYTEEPKGSTQSIFNRANILIGCHWISCWNSPMTSFLTTTDTRCSHLICQMTLAAMSSKHDICPWGILFCLRMKHFNVFSSKASTDLLLERRDAHVEKRPVCLCNCKKSESTFSYKRRPSKPEKWKIWSNLSLLLCSHWNGIN